ncbi:MAG: dephospho-CoA kinase [Gammaproteobacteria bacterium]|nr:dephospho-CoA kinase [Gammaproteobacteria bacterium]
MIVGLTGGIGSGKSAAGKYFIELGIDVIDADHISKNILNKNDKAKELFIKKFSDKFLDKNKNINRDLLRSEIFISERKKNILESIIHPIVREEITEFINQSDSIYKLIMVPLIYETNSKDFYDKIIVIDCSEENQIARASKRDNKSKEDIVNIINNQTSRENRNSIADEIILNDSTLDNLENQVIKVHQKLLGININE